MASDEPSKLHMACLPPIRSINSTPRFAQRGNRDWSFFGETCDDEGQTNKVWLYYAKSTPIKRHVKVKGEANPYDPTYETYFEEREGAHMLDTFRVPVLFAISGMNNVDSAPCAIPKSPRSQAGSSITASPV